MPILVQFTEIPYLKEHVRHTIHHRNWSTIYCNHTVSASRSEQVCSSLLFGDRLRRQMFHEAVVSLLVIAQFVHLALFDVYF